MAKLCPGSTRFTYTDRKVEIHTLRGIVRKVTALLSTVCVYVRRTKSTFHVALQNTTQNIQQSLVGFWEKLESPGRGAHG